MLEIKSSHRSVRDAYWVPFDMNTYLSLLFSFQMHPLGLCNNNDEEDLYEYGWVGVVKLEQPELDPSCLTVLGKVKNWLFTLWSFCIVPAYKLQYICPRHSHSFYLPLMYKNKSWGNYTVQQQEQQQDKRFRSVKNMHHTLDFIYHTIKCCMCMQHDMH